MLLFFMFVFLVVLAGSFLLLPRFGKKATGVRLQKMKASPHYKAGRFWNIEETPAFTEDGTPLKIMKEMLANRKRRIKPKSPIPTVKTDLKALNPNKNLLIWFGHSSYLLQIDGIRFLVDPVLSSSASPVFFSNRAFKGTTDYQPEDIPAVDYLLITHDHYDHLDYKTLKRIRTKVDKIICPLGVGAHLERWHYPTENIFEKDWGETIALPRGMQLHTVTSRHFSGRRFRRNPTLWMAYILKTPQQKFYLGCDSGYGKHFKTIGERFGPFDWAFLENGQYNHYWKHIHSFPEETRSIAEELGAKKLIPLHSGKFALSTHAWDEPLKRLTKAVEKGDFDLLTPRIGEIVALEKNQTFMKWWETPEEL